MEALARLLYRVTYDRVAYEPIRADFLRWYEECYGAIEVDMESDNSQLVTMALEARSEACNYEPDAPGYNQLKTLNEAEEVVRYFAVWASIFCWPTAILLFLTGGLGYVYDYLQLFPILIWLAVGGVFFVAGSVYPFYYLLSRTLAANAELIRQYNEELVIPIARITSEERRRVDLIAYYIWHSSLCSTTNQCVIVFLGTMRRLFPPAYGYMCYRITENFSSNHDEMLEHLARRDKESLARFAGREFEIFKQERARRRK